MSKTAEQELRAQFWAFYKEEDLKYGEDYHDAGDVRILCERALERFVASLRSKELQERVEQIKNLDIWGEGFYRVSDVDKILDSALSGEATKEKDPVSKYVADYGELETKVAETLEAYNRECKRVDELTEEVDKKNLRIQELTTFQDNILPLYEEKSNLVNSLVRVIEVMHISLRSYGEHPLIDKSVRRVLKAVKNAGQPIEETKKLFVKEN